MTRSRSSTVVVYSLTLLFTWGIGACPPTLSAATSTISRAEGKATAEAHSHKAKKPGAKTFTVPDAAPILVQDLRYKVHQDYTRLVLDLQHNVTFTQSRQENPNRLIIELQNSRLSDTALAKAGDKTFPGEVSISQPHPHSVKVSLNLDTIGDYKLLPLSGPDRLVLDLYTRTDRDGPREDHPQAASLSARPVVIPTIKSAQPTARDIKLIVVDPGHGGKDPGAIGRSGAQEKDITLQVGLRLRDLIAAHLGKPVVMTRDRDVFVELGDRAKFANHKDADLFVSVHVNSHPQRSTKGLEIYHFGQASDRRALEVAARENGIPIKDLSAGVEFILADKMTDWKIDESRDLAWTTKQAMVARLDDHYDVVDHGVKTAPFYVLRYTAMPSI
ncbi:MAG: N-acetylmuramoyl-L-alanine amidase, partial [Nitrospirae bacterium]|nr:N-acetylmuramoyl-L-alanine amidase [Nitrospirota bacterium]